MCRQFIEPDVSLRMARGPPASDLGGSQRSLWTDGGRLAAIDGTGCIELTVRSRSRANPGLTHEDAVLTQVVKITRDSTLSAGRERGSGVGVASRWERATRSTTVPRDRDIARS